MLWLIPKRYESSEITNYLILIQHMYHCGKVQGKFSDKFGRSLSLVGELFLLPFHIESIASTILCIVSRFLADLALFRLMKSCLRLRSRSQCMLSIAQCILAIVLSRLALPWNWRHRTSSRKISDHQIFSPLQSVFRQPSDFHSTFPVRNQVISTKDTAYSGLYSAMFKKRAFRIYIHRLCKFDIVLNPISQSPLVCLQLDKEITAFSRILSMMAFWKDMASAVTMHPDTSTLFNSLGTEVISLLFLHTCPWQGWNLLQGNRRIRCRGCVRFKYRPSHCLAVNTEDVPGTTDKLIMEGGGKFRHPLRHGFIINMFEYTAERRFRRHAVQQIPKERKRFRLRSPNLIISGLVIHLPSRPSITRRRISSSLYL